MKKEEGDETIHAVPHEKTTNVTMHGIGPYPNSEGLHGDLIANNSKGVNCGLRNRSPRIFDIITIVVIPLLLLVLVAMFFGHFMSVLESKDEKEANNAALRDAFLSNISLSSVVPGLMNSVDDCLDNRPADINFDNLKEYIHNCTKSDVDTHTETINWAFTALLYDYGTNNWITCKNKDYPSESAEDQQTAMYYDWLESQGKLQSKYTEQGLDETMAFELSVEEASGTENCHLNSPAGAIFWFVIMTTIGYGNVAPVTFGGRMMVYTLGFFSILLFSVVVGRAGSLVLKLVEDFFQRQRYLKHLTQGFTAVFFWLVFFWLWNFFVALIYMSAHISITGEKFHSFTDAYWWAYISMTTVGLGDIYVGAENMRYKWLLALALIMLLGFVFLANFIVKLAQLTQEFSAKYKFCFTGVDLDELVYGENKDGEVDGEKKHSSLAPKEDEI